VLQLVCLQYSVTVRNIHFVAGDLELLYVAVQDLDGQNCASEASRVAREINQGRQTAVRKRRQRQTTGDEAVDPIINFMTVATTLDIADTTGDNGGNSGNGGAFFCNMSHSILFAALLLAAFLFY